MIRQYMIALTMGAAGLAACTENSESSDILGVTADQTMRVGIAGPLVIRENGTYQWHARLFGVVAGAQYTWELVRAGAPDSEPLPIFVRHFANFRVGHGDTQRVNHRL
jgi:hypothetical protein